MAIQFRRGLFEDFNDENMVVAEPAIVLADDENVSDGKAFYIAFGPGDVKRVLTQDELNDRNSKIAKALKMDGVTGSEVNRRAVCTTEANVAAKTASITSGTFTLAAGARVTLSFTNANTASNPTLNVNNTGAKAIYFKGAQITTGSEKSLLSDVVDLIYSGVRWDLIASAPVIDNITTAEIDEIITDTTPGEIDYLLDWYYPVGSYYETPFSNFNPNVSWGGTWILDPDAGALVIDSNAQAGTVDGDLAAVIADMEFADIDSTNPVYRWRRTA